MRAPADPVATSPAQGTRRKGVEMSPTRKLLVTFYVVAFAAVCRDRCHRCHRQARIGQGRPARQGAGLRAAPRRHGRQGEQGLLRRPCRPVPEPRVERSRLPTDGTDDPPEPGPLPRRLLAPGVDEKLPGLIVLLSTSTVGARNAQNLANLFNLTGFTNQKTNEIWDTWIVGAPQLRQERPLGPPRRCCR